MWKKELPVERALRKLLTELAQLVKAARLFLFPRRLPKKGRLTEILFRLTIVSCLTSPFLVLALRGV